MDTFDWKMANTLRGLRWTSVVMGLLFTLLMFSNIHAAEGGSRCRCRAGNIRCLVTCGSSGDSSLYAIPFKRKYALMSNLPEFDETDRDDKRSLDRPEDALDDLEALKNYGWLFMDNYEDFNKR